MAAQTALLPSLSEPLLAPEDVESPEADAADAPAQRTGLQKLISSAVYVVVGAGALASVAAMAITQAGTVIAAGVVCVLNAPFAAYKEKEIAKLPALRSVLNKLQDEANDLKIGVDDLSREIDRLEPDVKRAGDVQQRLDDLIGEAGFTQNQFNDLLNESEKILHEMRSNVRQRIAQDVMRLVMQYDHDNSGSIQQKEMQLLSLAIKQTLHEYEVDFDERKFMRVMGSETTVEKAITIIMKLFPSGEGGDGERPAAEDDDDEEDMYDMFHLEEGSMYNKGSIHSAKHGRQGWSGSGRSLRMTARTSRGGVLKPTPRRPSKPNRRKWGAR